MCRKIAVVLIDRRELDHCVFVVNLVWASSRVSVRTFFLPFNVDLVNGREIFRSPSFFSHFFLAFFLFAVTPIFIFAIFVV